MDEYDFSELFTSGDLSDCQLVLDDGKEKISLNIHKCILYVASPYFRGMFGNFSEQKSNSITITVHNSLVSSNIIKSFYGIKSPKQNDWKYKLDKHICKNFFGLKSRLINNVKVPKTNFDEFLDTIELIGYNKKTLKMIINNIPKNYDIDKLPLDLLQNMVGIYHEHDILFVKNATINILSLNTKRYIHHLKINGTINHFENIRNRKLFMIIDIFDNLDVSDCSDMSDDSNDSDDSDSEPSEKPKKFFSYKYDQCVCVFDTTDYTIKKYFFYKNNKRISLKNGDILYYIPNCNQIIIGNNGYIDLFDLDSKKFIKNLGIYETVYAVYVDNDVLYIVDDYGLHLKQFSTGKKLSKFKISNERVTNGDKFIIISDKFKVTIWSKETRSVINEWKIPAEIVSIIDIPKLNYIIVATSQRIYIYDSNTFLCIKEHDVSSLNLSDLEEFKEKLIIITCDYGFKIFDLDSGLVIDEFDVEYGITCLSVIKGQYYDIIEKIKQSISKKLTI
ncbi:putative BTB/POZ domain-containing protein [Acanthamoeba polyphaga mimivirus]|uniref:BTB/POZ domain-containing protein n=1 Tax=Acanthamoeba polyphaga mimivirus Kroon TaxID=3069720 RepID=A0A0G2Y270_9VIRU|nr:putative BTB/POZ domain-containing protein [Acanthamoeba polyphaga mimivirus]AKI79828.1 putative BTB/POZ domain-containing protein [Acanthamoeba polyphaga mimivirus Kroon]